MADTTEHPPDQGDAPAPRRRVPIGAWIGGVVLCLLLLALAVCYLGYKGLIALSNLNVTYYLPTNTPENTLVPSDDCRPGNLPTVACTGVTRNSDWTPYIWEFDGVEMALVPAGCFMMGSEDGENDEQPVHEVCFEEPFWIDVYEVTNGQYGAAADDCIEWSSEDDQPRNCIDWFDAKAHCEARGARLPTEAEWEYAARGPDGLVYPWGNTFDCSLGNFDDETEYSADVIEGGAGCDGFIVTSPVGSFPGGASWVGVVDLSGNVEEWVNDWYDEGYYAGARRINPQGPAGVEREARVLRGGSWSDEIAFGLRATDRTGALPRLHGSTRGFRCALSYMREEAFADQPTPAPDIALAIAGVSSNNQWTPYIQEFDGVPMVLVPAGCFMMGSEDGEENERPVHEVCFEEPFWIDAYEVTNTQFTTFGGVAGSLGGWRRTDRPREHITWTESAAFCELRGARLPTEAEWEYAARGPDGLVYPWGNEFILDNVVYEGNSDSMTWTVGSRPGGVSWVGALDLSGNVWEWVADWYDAGYYGTLSDGVVNPQGPGTGEIRVLRGGSWANRSSLVRAAYRGKFNPSLDGNSLGFRCTLSWQP